MPSGASANSPGVGRTGTSGVSNVFATALLARSTPKSLPDSEVARSQWPSFVIMEENAILGREIDRTTELFAVSMITMRSVSWSCVKTNLPSGEIEMRCTLLEIGIVASKQKKKKKKKKKKKNTLFFFFFFFVYCF